MELCIYSYSHKGVSFSAPGDSGSIVANGEGRRRSLDDISETSCQRSDLSL